MEDSKTSNTRDEAQQDSEDRDNGVENVDDDGEKILASTPGNLDPTGSSAQDTDNNDSGFMQSSRIPRIAAPLGKGPLTLPESQIEDISSEDHVGGPTSTSESKQEGLSKPEDGHMNDDGEKTLASPPGNLDTTGSPAHEGTDNNDSGCGQTNQIEDISSEDNARDLTSTSESNLEGLSKPEDGHCSRIPKIAAPVGKGPLTLAESQIDDISSEDHAGIPKSTSESKQEGLSKPGDGHKLLIGAVLVALLAMVFLQWQSRSNPLPDPKEESIIDIFRREFENVKSRFPSQRPELWKRSKIHLERHLQTEQPTEPVSMILTSGRRAEKTLKCLASLMAAAFSSALNASAFHIDGNSKASLDSDQVKMDIDEKLRRAFEDSKGTAVIHRFEELPPASTLIFYRYCDHENAAFKGASLIFTVLLEENEFQPHVSLSAVEEMVQDHIQDKFLSSVQPATFDKMDFDKLGGLWSRISHLILPVAAEKQIEEHGCRT